MQPPSTVPRVVARRILLLTTTCLLNLKRSFASKEINKQKKKHKHINSTQYHTIRPPRYTSIKTAQPTATKWIEQANPSINNVAQISEKFISTITCLLKLQTMNHFKRNPQKSISATTLTAHDPHSTDMCQSRPSKLRSTNKSNSEKYTLATTGLLKLQWINHYKTNQQN